jgi:hypothetical protein
VLTAAEQSVEELLSVIRCGIVVQPFRRREQTHRIQSKDYESERRNPVALELELLARAPVCCLLKFT